MAVRKTVVAAPDDLGGMLYCGIPILHIERNPCPKRVNRAVLRINRIETVVLRVEQLLSHLQVGKHKGVGFLEGGALRWLRSEIAGRKHYSQLVCCGLRLVGLAEKLDELAVGQGPAEIGLSRQGVKLKNLSVVGKAFLERSYHIQIVVALPYGIIKGRIDRLYVHIVGTYVPLPEVHIGIGVALHGVHEVCLYVRADGKTPAVEASALEGVVYAVYYLLGVGKVLHSLVDGNIVPRYLFKAGAERQGSRKDECRFEYIFHHIASF